MSVTLPGLSDHWVLVIAGWSAVVILWHSTALALLLAAWRLGVRRASAQRHYAVSLGALAVTLAMAVATPFLLAGRPAATAPSPAAAAFSTFTAAPGSEPTRAFVAALPVSDVTVSRANDIAGWVGLVWAIGAALGATRLAAGLATAQWIRRRALPVSSPAILEAAAHASALAQRPAAALCASEHVDAPVVIGHRAPAVILPFDATEHLPSEALPPLIAHELAHVIRHDYITNIAQSLVDAALFFSPGARWISRCVREAREYCCDDFVVERCGGPRPYIDALTTLAALAALSRARPALGAAGPRLIVRVRRLLQEDVMTNTFVASRLTAVTVLLAAVVLFGSAVVPMSASAVADAAAQARTPGPAPEYEVPWAYPSSQDGSGLTLLSFTPSAEGRCGTIRVRNNTDVPVSGLRFIAVVSSFDRNAPMRLFFAETDLRDVHVPPGEEGTIAVGLMPSSEVYTRMHGAKAQVMCALKEIRFGNNATWQITPNPAAATAETALGLVRPQLSPALVGVPPADPTSRLCRDQHGAPYSPGAIIGIELEPGRRARCANGQWIEYVAP